MKRILNGKVGYRPELKDAQRPCTNNSAADDVCVCGVVAKSITGTHANAPRNQFRIKPTTDKMEIELCLFGFEPLR